MDSTCVMRMTLSGLAEGERASRHRDPRSPPDTTETAGCGVLQVAVKQIAGVSRKTNAPCRGRTFVATCERRRCSLILDLPCIRPATRRIARAGCELVHCISDFV